MVDRWVEVSPSPFPHEAEGLRIVRDLLPDAAPYRAWTNFEFRDAQGTWSEVDLLLLTPAGLHLVELKYYAGRLRGDDNRWLRDGKRAEDSPLMLANRKAKRLRSKLVDAYEAWVRTNKPPNPPPARDVIPFITAAVFLHHPSLVCDLNPGATQAGLYGLPGDEQRSNLAPITDLIDLAPRPGTKIYEDAITGVMKLIGLRAHERTVGSFTLDQQPFEDGPGWQDWLATHKILGDRRRIRFRVLPEGSPEQARQRVRLVTGHEMQVMQRLHHDAILRPEDIVDSDLGPGLVYPYDPTWQRLDLWLAEHPRALGFDDQLALVRQIAEALQYAHGKNVVHRRLNPRAVLVREAPDGRLHARLTDWQGVGRTDAATSTQARGLTTLADADAAAHAPDDQGKDAFTAPDEATSGPNRVRLDVFGLGALALFIVTGGASPAGNRAELVDRLRSQVGLDVSVQLPQATPALREAILQATRPAVSERLADVASFLELLADAATPVTDEAFDPLDATSGAVLGGRFTLVRRLGAGSTAVGLLVTDSTAKDPGKQVVLKVARDDAAARRLADEAEALARLTSPRVVKLLEGPLDVGGRHALLLEQAGAETLATHLGNRDRLSLDLLERWGTDLLETLVTLDQAGIVHRDIKPANLGVREDRSNKANREKHLMLFDFSLTRAAASDTQAGTRPYLDPFLSPKRPYDSAAERYAAAVVLFEMATGQTPQYGDGLSDPQAITDEATIDPAVFDPSTRARLVEFFTRALARDALARHHTADEMLLAWRAAFPDSSVLPADADERAEGATAATPLTDAGLTPRAVSALEQLGILTVGDLAQVDAVRLNGIVRATRQEINGRAKSWRARFRKKDTAWRPADATAPLGDSYDAIDTLVDAARRDARSDTAVRLASLILGSTGSLDANASQAELAAAVRPPVTRARVSQVLATLQERWAEGDALRLLDLLTDAVDARLDALGGVATFDELALHLTTLMRGTAEGPSPTHLRHARGLLRCTIDRKAAVERAERDDESDAESGWFQRRREGRLLVATRHDLLEVAEALGRRADALIGEANLSGTGELVPAARVAEQLGQIVDAAERAVPARAASPYDGLRDGHRLATLAARLSQHAGASASGELHHRDLPPADALRAALPAVAPGASYTEGALRARVSARFPDAAPLPKRPALDEVVHAAGLALRWDDKAYRAAGVTGGHTTGLTRPATTLSPGALIDGPGAVGQRLVDSRARRSFLALGVEAHSHDRLVDVLRTQYGAVTLDLSHILLDALHDAAAAINLPWSEVLAADAGAAGSRAHQGLRALVQRALPQVGAAIDAATAGQAEGVTPVVLTDAALLARYEALGILTDLMDLSTRRPTAVWLVVPQLYGSTGAMVDGRALPLTAPNQYVPVPATWVDAQHRTREGAPA